MKLIEIGKDDLEALSIILLCWSSNLKCDDYLDKIEYPKEKRPQINKLAYNLLINLLSKVLSEDDEVKNKA